MTVARRTRGVPGGPRRDAEADADPLLRALSRQVAGEVRFDAGSRALYATDASNYRQTPVGVVVPRDLDDVVATVAACREYGVPVLSRGGGTSLAGQCCNAAVVMDFSKYVNQVESIDERSATAIVQPGTVLDELNRYARRHGNLVFGPRPSTHSRCTVGGMIGNNSCGSTAQWSGTTAENVRRLEILTYDGTRMWVGATPGEEYQRVLAGGGRPAEIYRRLRELRDRHAGRIRGFPRLPRRVSGYNLPALLPENGLHLARALVGTESTCVTILRAEVDLLPEPPVLATVVLGYPDIVAAARAVPEVNAHGPFTLEGLDDKLVGYVQRKHLHPEVLHRLPEGDAWLMVQFGGDTADEARGRVDGLLRALRHGEHPPPSVLRFDSPVPERALWSVREAALAATARIPGQPDTWPGWEDSAVPPERLGDYLRDFIALLAEFDYAEASLYGHFGHGCLHTSLPFDLVTADGVATYRAFVERAASICLRYGGSLSGEHGDGQARGELLARMYGADVVRVFEEFKGIFDPDNRMNPGKVVHPNALDDQLRMGPRYAPADPVTHYRYPEDKGSFARAANRCVGVGECRRHEGGVMCPSYLVTREERHSTRGRARLLFEMLRGETITGGWHDEAVAEALDLCLACKGCKSDCPVNVDMATYKAEFMSHHYAGRIRPRDHYSLGWLPVLARVAMLAPGTANALVRAPGLGTLARALAGVDPQREPPRFAPGSFKRWFRRRAPRGSGRRGEVLLWPDTFTTYFAPGIAAAAVGVLEAAGFRVVLPGPQLCCGLTWISTGQLGTARRALRRTVDALAPYLRSGVPMVGLEPSCTAVFRSDAGELLGYRADIRRLATQTRTLAELLAERAPDFAPRLRTGDGERPKAVVQTHCHQHATLGFAADVDLMARIGLDARVLDSGCCGLAGNFGMVPAHREVSLACAERVLLPAVREADPATLVLADGFSCRLQIDDAGTSRRPVHLAEAVNAAVRGVPVGSYPERALALRTDVRHARH